MTDIAKMDPGIPNPSEIDWVPFALTHVEYPKGLQFSCINCIFMPVVRRSLLTMVLVLLGDFIGKLLAIASLMPMAIIAGFITLIMFRRDLHTVRI